MEELLAAILFSLMGTICFLVYKSIKNRTGGWLLANQKFGAIVGMVGSVIAMFILLFHACNRV